MTPEEVAEHLETEDLRKVNLAVTHHQKYILSLTNKPHEMFYPTVKKLVPATTKRNRSVAADVQLKEIEKKISEYGTVINKAVVKQLDKDGGDAEKTFKWLLDEEVLTVLTSRQGKFCDAVLTGLKGDPDVAGVFSMCKAHNDAIDKDIKEKAELELARLVKEAEETKRLQEEEEKRHKAEQERRQRDQEEKQRQEDLEKERRAAIEDAKKVDPVGAKTGGKGGGASSKGKSEKQAIVVTKARPPPLPTAQVVQNELDLQNQLKGLHQLLKNGFENMDKYDVQTQPGWDRATIIAKGVLACVVNLVSEYHYTECLSPKQIDKAVKDMTNLEAEEDAELATSLNTQLILNGYKKGYLKSLAIPESKGLQNYMPRGAYKAGYTGVRGVMTGPLQNAQGEEVGYALELYPVENEGKSEQNGDSAGSGTGTDQE
jgi:hypothetical protein